MTHLIPYHLGAAAIATAVLFATGPVSAQGSKQVFATNGVGSAANRVGAAISGVVSQKTSHTMVATAYAGPSVYVPLLSQGRAQFGFMNGVDSLHAYRGTKPYYNQAHSDFRLAAIGLTNFHAWVVRKDSGIRTAADLKGKRIAGIYAGHSTCRQLASAHLANYGLTPNDVTIVPSTGAVSSIKLLASGRVDAATCAVVGMGVIREADAQIGVRHLSMDPSPEAVTRFREKFPSGQPVKVDSHVGPALPEPTWVWEYPFYLVTSTNTSDQAVYDTVKAVWENLDDLRGTMAAFNRWKKERMASVGATVPYHDAAIRFYKEKGVWSSELEAQQTQQLK
jgi:TRAP transporter TAXI family solute receptor